MNWSSFPPSLASLSDLGMCVPTGAMTEAVAPPRRHMYHSGEESYYLLLHQELGLLS